MSVVAVETYETRAPDGEGWRGIPFRHPRDVEIVGQSDGGKHDGGPMPPEAPRDPQPQPQS
ncbi:hypothetical protein ADL22_02425 [Streptomyces sp. NRRL F-4489]|uniref:hypothetical protein n=1 Tax=Streptomyces sp. NRRL F-4489 TaxID=1609095 RepID=UPI00074AF7C7|nr:hypothetical protein [Streptomyces sp. NRRL F-4489]KUL54775.1 hypothetical protein ADL22_02425 [Streptomyces sp. NRRL F-4489]